VSDSVALPVVAVVGRPNVGKSTLVNRFLGRQEAIVEEKPGVTRDRKEVDVDWAGRTFRLVDTGGWLSSKDALATKVSEQSERATSAADLILFVVDAATGITEEDELAAQWVRRSGRPVMLLVNKVDSDSRDNDIWDFARLGLGEPWAFSALHGRNSGDVLDHIISQLPVVDQPDEPAGRSVTTEPHIAIVGRPNVGKSTLFNRLVGDERAVVHDMPGTTRDTIDTVVETDDGPVRFVDTAGMRRKSRVDEGTEYYSMVRALQAIDTVDAVVFVIDAVEGVTHQDQRLAERIDVSGKPMILVLNKWEMLDAEQRVSALAEMEDRLGFVKYAPTLKITALSGKGVHKLMPAVRDAIEAYTRRLPTAEVTKVIREAQQAHGVPGVNIFYAMQGAAEPPTFILFTNRSLPAPYLRYLERKLREHFELGPSPIKLRVRRKGA
jgi:GTPase